MASVFARLAHQGTAASDARLAEIREHQQQRRADDEAASLYSHLAAGSPTKLRQLHPLQDELVIKSPKRTQKQQNEFFNRLAHQETTASAAHHMRTTDHHEGLDDNAKTQENVTRTKGSNEVFNRLYKQETVATKAHHFIQDEPERVSSASSLPEKKCMSPRQKSALFNRLYNQATAATKAHQYTKDESELASSASSSPSEKGMSPERSALFNRLHKQETAATRAHHYTKDKDQCPPSPSSVPERCMKPRELSAVFNRLYNQETAATMAHHYIKEEGKPQVETQHQSFAPKSKKPQIVTPPSLLKRREHDKPPGPPVPISMKLYIRTRVEKEESKPSSTLHLSQATVRKQINLFHSGKISAQTLASDVITALFEGDFMPGDHWDIYPASAREQQLLDDADAKNKEEGDEGIVSIFEAEKEAIWDWKDIYSVASADATIKISSGDIHVDDYRYYVAG